MKAKKIKDDYETINKKKTIAVMSVICVSLVGGLLWGLNHLPETDEQPEMKTNGLVQYEGASISLEDEYKYYKAQIEAMAISDDERLYMERELLSQMPYDSFKELEGLVPWQIRREHEKAEEERQKNTFVGKAGKVINGIIHPPVYLEGTDKNGNPYLKKGAEYTFREDGMPVEAPSDGMHIIITSPVNGKEYSYGSINEEWHEYTLPQDQERAYKIARREMNAEGRTDVRHLTDEEIHSVNYSTNIGSFNPYQ